MNEAAAEILSLIPMEQAFLVFMRVGTAFFLLPGIGSRNTPPKLRLMIAFLFTYLLVPLSGQVEPDLSRAGYVAACGNEVISGAVIGFLCRSLFWAIEIAGTMAAQAISLAQILGNQVEQPQPAIGQFLYYAALALAMLLDFHFMVLKAMIDSYQLMPIGTGIAPEVAAKLTVDTFVRLFDIAVGLAGPFLVIAVLYNLCLGVINKAMPQLMVAFVGAPAISWLGLLVLMLSAPVLLSVWKDHLLGFSLLNGLR